MTFAEYLALEGANWSSLKHLRVSPRHYKAALTAPRTATDAMKLGSAVDVSVLEPDRFPLEFVVWDGGTRRGAEWNAFGEAHEGSRTILTASQYEYAIAIRNAVRSHPLARPYLEGGTSQHTVQWTDAKTGLLCKGRLDYLGRAITDLKTARDAIEPRLFAAVAWRTGYVHQLAHYRRGVEATTDGGLSCVIVAVESARPFDLAVYRLDEGALARADFELDEMLALLKRCRETDQWPGRFDEVQEMGMPRWATPEMDEDLDLDDPDWVTGGGANAAEGA